MEYEFDENSEILIEGNLLDEEEEPWVLPQGRDREDLNSVDTRRIGKDAISLASSSYSIDKTIKKIYKTKTIAREKPTLKSRKDIDPSLSKSVSMYDPNFRLESHAKALSSLERFKLQSWVCFNKFSIKLRNESEKFDGCSQGIPIESLFDALWNLSDHYNKKELASKIEEKHYENNSILSWTEFKDLVKDIFQPFLLLLSKKYVDYYANEPASRANTTLDPNRLSYQRLLEKSRYSTSREGAGVDSITMTKSTQQLPINAESMQISDSLVPRGAVAQQILNVVRKSYRHGKPVNANENIGQHSSFQTNSGVFNDSKSRLTEVSIGDLSNSKSETEASQLFSSEINRSAAKIARVKANVPPTTKFVGSDVPAFMTDLEKSKVADLINPNQSYPDKWKAMKSKRDERYIHSMCNMAKSEMVGTLQRIVAIDEKDRTRNMVKVIRYNIKKERLDQADKNRAKEEKMWDNWEEYKRKDQLNKSKFKKSLDTSLKEACDMARSQIEAERQELAMMRENVITRLDSTSSSIVSIPSEMKDVVKHAKSYKEFKEGKAAIKKYYEDTMSARIQKFNRSRSEAVIESMNATLYPVSVTPFHGTEYFEDPAPFNDSLSQVSKHSKSFSSPSKLKKSASTPKMRNMQSNNSSPDSRNSLDDSSIEMLMSEYLERSFENEVRLEIDSLNLGSDPDSRSLEIILNAPKLEDRRIDNDDISWLSDQKLPKLKF